MFWLTTFTTASLLCMTALASVPAQFDWRKKGVVPPVSNQGQLGRSDVYAAIGAVESSNAIRTGRLQLLSIGEMSDCCAPLEPSYACILKLHGLCTESAYPSSTGRCHSSSCTSAVTITGYVDVMKNETALLHAVLQTPVSAVINAGLPSFQLYRGGIYDDPKCTDKQLDHAVLIVGYGTMNGKDYWICQNSWGTSWGEQGYIRIARNKGNMCGIASAASYPTM